MTWKDVVREALTEIGSSGHLNDIYSQIEGHPKTETNPTYRIVDGRLEFQRSLLTDDEMAIYCRGCGKRYVEAGGV